MNILAICCALNNTYLGFEFDDKKFIKLSSQIKIITAFI